ncbi:MAG: hypothetical protein J6Q02_03080, partial [Lachnospiraceae bacterium]|nr:hypothetical protein [Lachnospiraceae bacterium]
QAVKSAFALLSQKVTKRQILRCACICATSSPLLAQPLSLNDVAMLLIEQRPLLVQLNERM